MRSTVSFPGSAARRLFATTTAAAAGATAVAVGAGGREGWLGRKEGPGLVHASSFCLESSSWASRSARSAATLVSLPRREGGQPLGGGGAGGETTGGRLCPHRGATTSRWLSMSRSSSSSESSLATPVGCCGWRGDAGRLLFCAARCIAARFRFRFSATLELGPLEAEKPTNSVSENLSIPPDRKGSPHFSIPILIFLLLTTFLLYLSGFHCLRTLL